jgi:hypothetical protein
MDNFHTLKKSVLLILSGHLLLGIGYISFLPPWEGFDETAHYSSVQQIADTGTIPRYGSSSLSAEVEDYVKFAPFPYSGSPPVEDNGGYTYKSFFEAPKEKVERGTDYIQNEPNKPRNFIQGENINWQAQHPPLYYLILAPIYLLTNKLSWINQLLILRLISYLFAWIALVIGAQTCLELLKSKYKSDQNSYLNWMIIGIAIWPVIFPSWFTDMARMGNDSLCALIIALIWMLLIKHKDSQNYITYILVGSLL